MNHHHCILRTLLLSIILSILTSPYVSPSITALTTVDSDYSIQVSGEYFFQKQYNIDRIAVNWLDGELYAQGHYRSSLISSKSPIQLDNNNAHDTNQPSLIFSFGNYPTVKLDKPIYSFPSGNDSLVSAMKVLNKFLDRNINILLLLFL